jgi:hypothetical protein
MKADKTLAVYRSMRDSPFWQLLAATNGPTIIAILQTQLFDTERSLPESIFYERLRQ